MYRHLQTKFLLFSAATFTLGLLAAGFFSSIAISESGEKITTVSPQKFKTCVSANDHSSRRCYNTERHSLLVARIYEVEKKLIDLKRQSGILGSSAERESQVRLRRLEAKLQLLLRQRQELEESYDRLNKMKLKSQICYDEQ